LQPAQLLALQDAQPEDMERVTPALDFERPTKPE